MSHAVGPYSVEDYTTYDQLLLDAYRRYGMSKLRREQLLAIIAHHDSKPGPTEQSARRPARRSSWPPQGEAEP
jgi:hypothetical protein